MGNKRLRLIAPTALAVCYSDRMFKKVLTLDNHCSLRGGLAVSVNGNGRVLSSVINRTPAQRTHTHTHIYSLLNTVHHLAGITPNLDQYTESIQSSISFDLLIK